MSDLDPEFLHDAKRMEALSELTRQPQELNLASIA